MRGVLADTHAILWYLQKSPKLSDTALGALLQAANSGAPIFVSPISVVEVTYLAEKGRLASSELARLVETLRDPGADLVVAPLELNVAESLRDIPAALVPDMPDRIIAATALCLGVPLVTRDTRIRSTSIETIW